MTYPDEADVAILHELLPNASPEGALCLGAIMANAAMDNLHLPRQILEQAVKCTGVDQVDKLYGEYKEAVNRES